MPIPSLYAQRLFTCACVVALSPAYLAGQPAWSPAWLNHPGCPGTSAPTCAPPFLPPASSLVLCLNKTMLIKNLLCFNKRARPLKYNVQFTSSSVQSKSVYRQMLNTQTISTSAWAIGPPFREHICRCNFIDSICSESMWWQYVVKVCDESMCT